MQNVTSCAFLLMQMMGSEVRNAYFPLRRILAPFLPDLNFAAVGKNKDPTRSSVSIRRENHWPKANKSARKKEAVAIQRKRTFKASERHFQTDDVTSCSHSVARPCWNLF